MSPSRKFVAFLCLGTLPLLMGIDVLRRANPDVEKGNARLAEDKATEALDLYDKAARAGVSDPGLELNRGNALSSLGRHGDAVNAYLLATRAPDPAIKQRAFFNLGNAFFRGEKWAEAVDAFKRALSLNPSDESARWNLELALRKKRDDEKKQDQKKQDGEKNKEEKKEDNKEKNKDENKDQKDQQDKQDPQAKKDPSDKGQQQPNEQSNDGQKPETPPDKSESQDKQGSEDKQKPGGAEPQKSEGTAGDKDRQTSDSKAQPTPAAMKEIDAILQSLERSPRDLARERARLRAIGRRPPLRDW